MKPSLLSFGTALLVLGLLNVRASAAESPFSVSKVTAQTLDRVAMPAPLNELDAPHVWTPTPPPQGKRYVDLQLTLAVDWPGKDGLIHLDRSDVSFGSDQAEILGTFSYYASLQSVDPKDKSARLFNIYKGPNLKQDRSEVKAELLVLVPAESKTLAVQIKDAKFDVAIPEKPTPFDVKSRFTWRVVKARLVASVPDRDGKPVSNPDGKILIVDVKSHMIKSDVVSGADGPLGVQFSHDWMNVRVGDKLFPTGGDVSTTGTPPKPVVEGRSSKGKNDLTTGGSRTPQFEAEDSFLFFVPADTKKFDLLMLGQSVGTGTAVAGPAN